MIRMGEESGGGPRSGFHQAAGLHWIGPRPQIASTVPCTQDPTNRPTPPSIHVVASRHTQTRGRSAGEMGDNEVGLT